MTDITPKITDLQSLKNLSKIVSLPMVMAAYIFQTGAVITWSNNIWLSAPQELAGDIQLRFLLILVLKALWSGVIAACLYSFLAVIHLQLNEWLLPSVATILLGLALVGLFGQSQFPQLRFLDNFCYYTVMVWGFFLHAMTDQLHQQLPQPSGRADFTVTQTAAQFTDEPLRP